jgi:hypothetical protein
MGLKGYRLWVMGQLDSTCRAPPREEKTFRGVVREVFGRRFVGPFFRRSVLGPRFVRQAQAAQVRDVLPLTVAAHVAFDPKAKA